MKPKRKTIRGKGWKKTPTIAQDKFDAVSRAILKVLPTTGLRWGVLADRVQALLPRFQGSVLWYTISVLRELETQGKVRRDIGPPVVYFKG